MRTPNYELEREDTRVESLIGGRFRLVSILGEGGMGTVYRARDRGQDLVALKVMKPELEASPRACKRFLRECELLQRIESPHVVQVYDAGRAPAGELYLAMELLDGQPLGELLHDGPIASFAQIASLAKQIALGVAAAHALDVVHRDLKPDNVFVAKDGGLRVLDFGIARLVDPPHLDRGTGKLTSTGAILGTPAYISPEAAAGEPVTASADLYSLGVLMYELITGELPFESEFVLVMMTKHLTEPAPDVRELRPDTPPALANLVALLLEKTPADRPSSALAVARQLASFESLDESPTLEAPVHRTAPIELSRIRVAAPDAPTSPSRSRSRALPAALGALGGLALLGIGAAVWAATAPESPAMQPAPITPAESAEAPPARAPSPPADPAQATPSGVEVSAADQGAETPSEANGPARAEGTPSGEAEPEAAAPRPRRRRGTRRASEPPPPSSTRPAMPTTVPRTVPTSEPAEPAAPRPGQLLDYGM